MAWLERQLEARGATLGYSPKHSDRNTLLRSTLKLLEAQLQPSGKSIFEQHIVPRANLQSTLILNYYRNGLAHVFWKEALVAAALSAVSQTDTPTEGITEAKLFESFDFL